MVVRALADARAREKGGGAARAKRTASHAGGVGLARTGATDVIADEHQRGDERVGCKGTVVFDEASDLIGGCLVVEIVT